MIIYLIQKIQNFWLLVKKVTILKEYLEFINFFLKKLIIMLFKYFNTRKYTINLDLGKKSSYKTTYSLKSIKLENFKTYIMINQTNNYI